MLDQPIKTTQQFREIKPSVGTFFKAFWSATWRANIYTFPFILPFYIPLCKGSSLSELYPIQYEIYLYFFEIFFLLIAMFQLNNIIYRQDNRRVSIKITWNAVWFYVVLTSIPYFISLVLMIICFGRVNEWIQTAVAVIPNLFIFYRMMTKGIMGFRMITYILD